MNGKTYRQAVEQALRHLGHRYSNPPNALIESKLADFCVGRRPKAKADRRVWLFNAAQRAMEEPAVKIDAEKRAPVHKESVRVRRRKADKFYASWEWKRVRYEALKLHGHRCQCCGWQPGDTPNGHLVVDHIKPRSKYPNLAYALSNMQVMCNDCNMGKSNIYEDDFRQLEDWFSNIMRE